MGYYKITTKEGTVSDVFDHLDYCRYDHSGKCFVRCDESRKQGVASQRKDACYHVTGWPEFGVEAPECDLTEIDLAEYIDLKDKLDKEDKVMGVIGQLTEKVNAQDIDISDLTDAVLELAEIIGG